MQRRLSYRPRLVMIALAIVICLIATTAFAQSRLPGAGTGSQGRSVGVTATAGPAPSGLTSGAAPGLTPGTPSASGITSGSAPATAAAGIPSPAGLTSGSTPLPSGTPAPSGLTSGTTGAAPGQTTITPGGDTTATATGGSTRGVVPQPAQPESRGITPLAAGTAPTTNTTSTTPTDTQVPGTTLPIGGRVVGGGIVLGGVPSVSANVQGPVTLGPLQVGQIFAAADADADGLLSRAEALRLALVTMSFEDMDTNRDGVVSRSEYDTSLR